MTEILSKAITLELSFNGTSETSKSLTVADHGSFVLAMVPVAATDSQGRRVAQGSVDIGGDYLCP